LASKKGEKLHHDVPSISILSLLSKIQDFHSKISTIYSGLPEILQLFFENHLLVNLNVSFSKG
jgi:hypothetical protein